MRVAAEVAGAAESGVDDEDVNMRSPDDDDDDDDDMITSLMEDMLPVDRLLSILAKTMYESTGATAIMELNNMTDAINRVKVLDLMFTCS